LILFELIILDKIYDEVYQLVVNMGGAGYIFTGEKTASLFKYGKDQKN